MVSEISSPCWDWSNRWDFPVKISRPGICWRALAVASRHSAPAFFDPRNAPDFHVARERNGEKGQQGDNSLMLLLARVICGRVVISMLVYWRVVSLDGLVSLNSWWLTRPFDNSIYAQFGERRYLPTWWLQYAGISEMPGGWYHQLTHRS